MQSNENQTVKPRPLSEATFKSSVEEYFTHRGYETTPIPENPRQKTPDYTIAHVMSGNTYLVELKAPELHIDPKTKLFLHKTRLRKIREFIKTAAKQFAAFDTKHEQSWILTFCSSHFQLHAANFVDAIQGYIQNPDGSLLVDLRSDPMIRNTSKYVRQIDAYLWLQVSSSGKIYQATVCNNRLSKLSKETQNLVGNLERTKVSSMDRYIAVN